jgi:hypothetical protein
LESKQRIGLYGSGAVPRSRRLGSRTAGPESLGLKDIRQLPPIRRVKPSGVRGKTVAASAIVALTAVIAMVVAISMAPAADQVVQIQAPPTPFPCTGIVYDNTMTPVGGANLTITNLRLGTTGWTSSDIAFPGFYIFDLSTLGQAQSGDIIRIIANLTTLSGTNETPVPTPMGGFMWLNVTMTPLAIPEFGGMLVPAVGMIGAFLTMALVARVRNE